MWMRTLPSLLVLLLAGAGCNWELDWDEARRERALKRDLEDILADGEAPGALAETEAGYQHTRARVGSNGDGEQPLPWDGQFRIASVSKTFTAVVVLQLVQEGKLSLDDSVEKLLPGVVHGNGNDGSKISVKQLLRHQSGLANYVESPQLGALLATSHDFAAHRNDTFTLAEYVAFALQEPPLFAAGERFAYSNTNYLLLGMIIEAIAHSSWGDQVRQRIVEPLGLQDTLVPGSNPALASPCVRGWMRFPDQQALVDVSENSLISGSDAGVVSTLADLNLFFRALMRGALLSPASLGAMQETVPIDDPDFPDGRYGLGLQWSPLRCGGGYWHHTGDTLGYSVRTGVSPDGARSAAIVVNGTLDSAESVAAAANAIDHALCMGR